MMYDAGSESFQLSWQIVLEIIQCGKSFITISVEEKGFFEKLGFGVFGVE